MRRREPVVGRIATTRSLRVRPVARLPKHRPPCRSPRAHAFPAAAKRSRILVAKVDQLRGGSFPFGGGEQNQAIFPRSSLLVPRSFPWSRPIGAAARAAMRELPYPPLRKLVPVNSTNAVDAPNGPRLAFTPTAEQRGDAGQRRRVAAASATCRGERFQAGSAPARSVPPAALDPARRRPVPRDPLPSAMKSRAATQRRRAARHVSRCPITGREDATSTTNLRAWSPFRFVNLPTESRPRGRRPIDARRSHRRPRELPTAVPDR